MLTEANVTEKLYSKPNSPVWLFVGAARKAPSPVASTKKKKKVVKTAFFFFLIVSDMRRDLMGESVKARLFGKQAN